MQLIKINKLRIYYICNKLINKVNKMAILIGKKQSTPVFVTKNEEILDTDKIVKWASDNKVLVGALGIGFFAGVAYFVKESKYAK